MSSKNNNSQLRIGIILNYVNLIIGNLIPIFYTPIMLSLMGQNEYGLYKLSSSVTSYLSLISMGLGSAVSRYLIKASTEEGREAEEKVLGLFVTIFRVISIAALVVGTAMSMSLHLWYENALTPEELMRMKVIVLILVCNMSISFAVSPYQSVVTSHEKFLFIQGMNILSTCLGPVLNLVVLFFGGRSIEMAISTMVINVLVNFLYLCYVRRSLRIRPRYKNMPVNLMREILKFSFWVFVANVVGQLYNATDTVMIGAIPALATAGTAIYSVGATFNNIVFSLTTGVSSVMGPRTNKLVFSGGTGAELTDLAIRVGRIQGYIIALIVTGFISFGRPFIDFYAGEGYEDAYWVAVFMMVPNMIPLVQSVCLSVIVAQNKHRFRSLVYLGIAVANVIGTWFMMQIMGIIGAALMTGIAVILGQGFIMNWYYWKKTNLNMKRFWPSIGKLYLIPSGMCGITLLLSRWIDFYQLPVMIIGIVIYTVVYCILNWTMMMDDYEKNIVLEPLNKIIRKNRRQS